MEEKDRKIKIENAKVVINYYNRLLQISPLDEELLNKLAEVKHRLEVLRRPYKINRLL